MSEMNMMHCKGFVCQDYIITEKSIIAENKWRV